MYIYIYGVTGGVCTVFCVQLYVQNKVRATITY